MKDFVSDFLPSPIKTVTRQTRMNISDVGRGITSTIDEIGNKTNMEFTRVELKGTLVGKQDIFY